MSRFDQPSTEPDYDRYETKPVEDVDVPDFDAPEPPIDPVEHAAHALIEALATFEKEIASNQDLARAWVLKRHTERAWKAVDRVASLALDQLDMIVERGR